MALWQGRSRRKVTGGRLKAWRKKRKHEMGREQTETLIGKERTKRIRVRGGHEKRRVLIAETANVLDPKAKKIKRAKILSVEENRANPHFVRRNILTKGAIVKTDAGRARVTSRPGQDGVVNAVLI